MASITPNAERSTKQTSVFVFSVSLVELIHAKNAKSTQCTCALQAQWFSATLPLLACIQEKQPFQMSSAQGSLTD